MTKMKLKKKKKSIPKHSALKGQQTNTRRETLQLTSAKSAITIGLQEAVPRERENG